MRIAQHFSAGIKSIFTNESVKRTAETESFTDFSGNRNLNLAFNRPLRGLNRLPDRTPAINRWAIFTSSAPADEMHAYFFGQSQRKEQDRRKVVQSSSPAAIIPATPLPETLRTL